MPVGKKAAKVKKKLKQRYGKKKGDSVFYAMEQEGKLPGQRKKKAGKKAGRTK